METIETKDFLFRDGTIKSYIGNKTNVVIPSEIDGRKVTKIGDVAFFASETLKRIVIPDTVTSIGDAAFQYCTNLVSVKMPDNIVEIGESAFDSCENLTCITPFVAKIKDEWVFFNCDKLKKVPIQNH